MKPRILSREDARKIWIRAQGLDVQAPFGLGKNGALAAIKRLGYVQIDTINVIERAHHHILHCRVPDYRPEFLHELQSKEKSVFEFWTHALSFIPTDFYEHYLRLMRDHQKYPSRWYSGVSEKQMRALVRRIRKEGPISMRQIDEEKQEKDHEWASRKPSKRALQFLFYAGRLVISKREGMLKHYELAERHFGWKTKPKTPTARQTIEFRIDRALDSQGVISLVSCTHLEAGPVKKAFLRALESRVRKSELTRVEIEGLNEKFYARSETLERSTEINPERIHILSPFDPLVIQRKRTRDFFGFDYLLECYVPASNRKYGYFCLPVLAGDRFVARLDLKADREKRKLLIQAWHWEKGTFNKKGMRRLIQKELERFHKFQFGYRPEQA